MPVIGRGATLEVDDGASNAFVEIADIVNLTVPDVEVGVVESKRLNLASATVVKLPALRNGGQFTFQYEFSQIKKTRLDALLGVQKNWKVTLPSDDGTPWVRTAPGILTSNKSGQVDPDQIQMVTGTVEVSGPAA